MEIREILIAERKKHGYTQQEVADKIGITRSSYAQYEIGRNTPTTDNIMRLADLYKCSTDYLLGRYNYHF